MKTGHKISVLSLAILMAYNTGAQANYPKKSMKTTPAATAKASTADLANFPNPTFKWDPTPDKLPANNSQFLTWVENINIGKSREHYFPCWRGVLCVSGLLDMDALYFDQHGNPFESFSGTGTRPQFGGKPDFGNTSQMNGSINNANVFVDLKFPELFRIHANIAYVNGSVKTDTYAWQPNADWGSTYRPAASVKADELFAVFSDANIAPVYFKVGRFYLDFGQYIPNGYGLPTITPSLTQLMTQDRTGGAQLGFAIPFGLYGSATWSMAQSSMQRPADTLNKASRNYSAKLGFMREFQNAKVNANVSYIWDITDVDYIRDTIWVINTYLMPALGDSLMGVVQSRRQHAFAGHADAKIGQFGMAIEGAATTGPLNPYNTNSTLWTAGADVSYDFSTFGHSSSVDLGYQVARNTAYIYGGGTVSIPVYASPTLVFPFSFNNQVNMPKNRIVGTYIVKVAKHANLALQWVRDKDFAPPFGSNDYSDFGIARIDIEF